jgi:hypothetical protein
MTLLGNGVRLMVLPVSIAELGSYSAIDTFNGVAGF